MNSTTTIGKGWYVIDDGAGPPELVTWGQLTLFERRYAQSALDAAKCRGSAFDASRDQWPVGTRLYEFWLVVSSWWAFDAPSWLRCALLALRWPR